MFKKSFIKRIAKVETVSVSFLEKQLKSGKVVIPKNSNKDLLNPVAIGQGLKIKINANIGTSQDKANLSDEIKKLKTAVRYGAHAVMDLSTGGDLQKIQKAIIKKSPVCVGTVPMYEIATLVERKKATIEKMKVDDIYDVLTEQAKRGVDFFTIHAGMLLKNISQMKKHKRLGGIVSRGGALITRWMYANKKENPFYENLDKVLDIMKKYNITMSLGDSLRPGAIADSTDRFQIDELKVLGELVKKCRKKGVQVMVEGPGHIKINEVAYNMNIQKKLCHGAPFYVLGPLTTDIACGYDHIVSAIGGAIAAMNGANFLCVVTPAEHLRHPSVEDIKLGVISSKIAAHSVDVLNFKDEYKKDCDLSYARARRQWKDIYNLALDKDKAKEYRNSIATASKDVCAMCGQFCSLKITQKCNLLKK